MEVDRFENLIRAVATRSSRRGFAGLLGSLALGGILTREDQDDAFAKNRRRRSRRHKRATDPFKPSPILKPSPIGITEINGTCAGPASCSGWVNPGNSCYGDVIVPGPCPPVTCATVAVQKGAKLCRSGTQCCRVEAATCADDCQCCGSLTCENGVCAQSRTCVEFGGLCSSSGECCRGHACRTGRCYLDQPAG